VHSEFKKLIDAAADIKSSGRWAAMNERIRRLTARPGVVEVWYVKTFSSLCYQLCSEYLQLEKAHAEMEEKNNSLLAWRARNILELCVWSIYFTKSKENARRIYEDAGRDAIEIMNAFENWGPSRANQPTGSIQFRSVNKIFLSGLWPKE
jgi:hypothetical protein